MILGVCNLITTIPFRWIDQLQTGFAANLRADAAILLLGRESGGGGTLGQFARISWSDLGADLACLVALSTP